MPKYKEVAGIVKIDAKKVKLDLNLNAEKKKAQNKDEKKER